MAEFYVFQELPSPGGDEAVGALDALIGAAGGKTLPGRWGLAQAVLAAVTQERHSHPALHWSKAALNVAGIVRAYRIDNDPVLRKKARRDPVAEYLAALGVSVPDEFRSLGPFVLSYLGRVPHEDHGFEERGGGDFVRTFHLADGLDLHYRLWRDGQSFVSMQTGESNWSEGPYVRKADAERLRHAFARMVWEAEGGSDLELTTTRSTAWSTKFTLSPIGTPGDYVDGDGTWTSVERLSARCEAFARAGRTRNILFHGPPGTGKTTLARRVARQLGDGRALRIEAEAVKRAGVDGVLRFLDILRPRVALFDDMDRCMDHVVELLHCFEQAGYFRLTVIATVNVVERLDPALLRPGRFDEVVEIPEPTDEHRRRIIEHYFDGRIEGLDLDGLCARTEGWSPADIRELFLSVATVGVEHLDAEVERLSRQRGLYAGDACRVYALRNAPLPGTAAKAIR